MHRAYGDWAKYQRSRLAFTLTELIIVIAIIGLALLLALNVMRDVSIRSQRKACQQTLNVLLSAAGQYFELYRDYPPYRYDGDAYWTDAAGVLHDLTAIGIDPSDNTRFLGSHEPLTESIEAFVYAVQYLSGAGDLLADLPSQVFANTDGDSWTVDGSPRPLMEVLDPSGRPIQYRRVAEPAGALARLSGKGTVVIRAEFYALGPDGAPGEEGFDDDGDNEVDFLGSSAGALQGLPDVEELGWPGTDDLKVSR